MLITYFVTCELAAARARSSACGAVVARVMVHIGQHKTGTTAIQKSLRSCADSIGRQGWSYPKFMRAANLVELPLIFAELDVVVDERHARLATPAGRSVSLAKIDAELRSRVTSGSRWTFSSEEFAGSLGETQVGACIDFFASHFMRVDAIM